MSFEKLGEDHTVPNRIHDYDLSVVWKSLVGGLVLVIATFLLYALL